MGGSTHGKAPRLRYSERTGGSPTVGGSGRRPPAGHPRVTAPSRGGPPHTRVAVVTQPRPWRTRPMISTPSAPDLAAVKARQQTTWAAGDYAVIGTTLTLTGELLCEA